MRRGMAVAAVWLIGTGVAVAVAWWGLSAVGTELTGSRPQVLTAAEVADLDRDTSSRRVGSSTTATGAPAPDVTPTSVVPLVLPPAAEPPAGTKPPETVPTTRPTPAETRTYQLVGGSASIRFEPGRVTLLWATPSDGFSAELHQDHAAELEIRFESSSHESRLKVAWEGQPVEEIREEPEGEEG